MIHPKQPVYSVPPYHYPNDVFSRNRKTHPRIHMKLQRAPNNHNNLKKKKRRWRTHTSQGQNFLQSFSHQNSVELGDVPGCLVVRLRISLPWTGFNPWSGNWDPARWGVWPQKTSQEWDQDKQEDHGTEESPEINNSHMVNWCTNIPRTYDAERRVFSTKAAG